MEKVCLMSELLVGKQSIQSLGGCKREEQELGEEGFDFKMEYSRV